MITVTKQENGVLFTFTNSDKYLYGSGTIEVPFNSLSIIQDESDNITLRKSASNDIFLSARYDTDFGYASKEEAVNALKEILYDEAGLSEEEVQEMIDAATSGIPSSEVVEQLRRDVNAVSGEVDTKQDILTAGENITISGNVISADAGNNIIELTQAEYDALETKDPEALYIITDAQEINMNDYYTKSEVYNKQEVDAAYGTAYQALTAHTADTTVHFTGTQKSNYDDLEVLYHPEGNWDIMPQSAFNDFTNDYSTAMGQFDQRITANESGVTELKSTKLDASAYTPTDLSEYWTSAQTQSAIDAATSGIPSSDVIEDLQNDVSNLWEETNNIYNTIGEKEEVIASALTQLNQDVSAIDAKEEVIASALTEVNQALNNKLDASAYTPTDLSQYWTSGQTQEAINAATSGIPSSQVIEQLRTDINTVSGDVENKQDALVYYSENTENKSASIHIEDTDEQTSGDLGVDGSSAMMFASGTETDVEETIVRNTGINVNPWEASMSYDKSIDDEPTTNSYVSVGETVGLGVQSDIDPQPYSHLNVNKGDISLEVRSDEDHITTFAVSNSAVTVNDERVLTESDGVYYINFETLTTQGIHDADWDGLIAAMNAHRPIYAGLGGRYYTAECLYQSGGNRIIMTASDELNHYFYTFTKNGSENYSFSSETRPYTTTQEKAAWNAKADASAITSIESSITAVSNDLNTLSGAVIDNEYTVSQAINSLNNRVTAVESGGSSQSLQYYSENSTDKIAKIAVDEYNMFEVTNNNVYIETKITGGTEGAETEEYTDANISAYGTEVHYEKMTGSNETDAHSYFDMNDSGISFETYNNEVTTTVGINDAGVTINDERVLTEGDVDNVLNSGSTNPVANSAITVAIDDAKAYYVDFAAMSVQGITDADWDGLVAAINAHRPILVKIGTYNSYVTATYSIISDNVITITGADGNYASTYTFTKNGSNDYSVSTSTKQFVTQAEKDAWNAKQDALTAGSGISISNNVISTSGVVMSQQVTQIVKLTQAQYDALSTKDNQTLYIVVD